MKRVLVNLGQSGVKKAVIDLAVLLRTRLLIQGASGSGKSWLIRRLVEQLFGKVQIFIIDPEGEFATLREKFDFVLVGKGGETPADVRSAAMVAHKLLELRASAIFDIFEMKAHQRHAWVRAFLEAMIDAPKKLWHPVVVVVDEAHTFCPEKGAGESEASEAMISLSTRGRKRGYCAVPATQRLSKLRKDFAAECQNILLGKTTLAMDRDRASDEIGVEKKRDVRDDFSNALRRLKPGEFYGTGPAISDDRILIRVGDVHTSHPESGSYKQASAPPPAPGKIKALLPKLADLPQAAEEKAKTEAELRKEVRSLNAQLRQRPKESVEVKVVDEASIARAVAKRDREWEPKVRALRALLEEAMKLIVKVNAIGFEGTDLKPEEVEEVLKATAKEIGRLARAGLKQRQHEFDRLRAETTRLLAKLNRALSKEELAVQVDVTRNEPVTVTPAATGPAYSPANGDGRKLRAGAERMLAALVRWHPNAMTEGQVRGQSGLKKSGTYDAYKRDIIGGGYAARDTIGLVATEDGLAYFDHVPHSPSTTEEVLAIWKPQLRDGARRMLDALVGRNGDPMSKEDLGAEAGLQKSGTFDAYLRDLRTAQLAVTNTDGTVAANREVLFL